MLGGLTPPYITWVTLACLPYKVAPSQLFVSLVPRPPSPYHHNLKTLGRSIIPYYITQPDLLPYKTKVSGPIL